MQNEYRTPAVAGQGTFCSAEAIVAGLSGEWFGHYGMCKCPSHKDGTPSLKVSIGRIRPVVVRCHAGCDQRNVITALRGLGLWDGAMASAIVSAPLADAPKPDSGADLTAAARRLWDRSVVPGSSSVVATYLRSRGLTGPIPDCLRLLSDAWNSETKTRCPAMVAAIRNGRGDITAISRTFLTPAGRKAAVLGVKKNLGPLWDGAVRLSPADHELGIGEGIETCMSASIIHGLPVWAALSAGRLHSVRIPDTIERLVIFGDPDEPGRRAAARAARECRREGRRVEVRFPEYSHHDFNDQLRASSGHTYYP